MIISFIENSNCIDINKWMGFGTGADFTGKKYGTCTSHELIVRLIPTWIYYDLITVSQIWPSNHQLP